MTISCVCWPVKCLLVLLVVCAPTLALGHGISATDAQAMLDGGILQYIQLGALHMLTGYDHLLFIFGIIFFLTGFRDIFKYITIFTMGHSLTLIFATLSGITANYYLIDAVIALSVCYKGFDNIDGFKKYVGIESPNLMAVIFTFGLVHGFGLSARLQELPLGQTGLVARILSFNLGVELGQIAALTLMLLCVAGWRKSNSFRQFSFITNSGLIFAGLLLFLMQMHGFQHTISSDSFTFPSDSHLHAHAAMASAPSSSVINTHETIDLGGL